MTITGSMISANDYTASSSSQSYTVTSGNFAAGDILLIGVVCQEYNGSNPAVGMNLPLLMSQTSHQSYFSTPLFRNHLLVGAKTLTAADIGTFVATVTCTATGVNKNWSLTISRFRDSGGGVLVVHDIAVSGADATPGPGATSVYGPAATVGPGVGVAFTEQASIGAMGLRAGQENGWGGVRTHISQCQQGFATKAFAASGTSTPMPGWASEKGADGFTAVTFAVGQPLPVLTHTGGMSS